ncbi:hypothetical protein SGUI_1306 [Serinicoccus hydrothermalis]|uniref:DUF4307 domain-containing protein n=1 Tax=Serinicoccus hydrothermalis TaxID=1758689 RepID=A0A1B1NBA6_9MICO|nr:DUF4307 domain-containing protein [Serinicoccus hydrothermalis]ANS78702.1 hypothetical protein SGUI_1306 [Serinicoccus hydrothermalis]
MTARSADPADPGPGQEEPDWDEVEEQAEAEERRRHGDRRWWVVGVVAVLVMSVLAVVWGLSATVGRVHWVDTGFEVVSDSQVDVRFDLRRDPSREAVCRLEAQSESHVVVGRTEVRVPPSDSSPSRHVESLTTASPAVTGYVEECWYADGAPR